jgi:predicted transcriptional regulator
MGKDRKGVYANCRWAIFSITLQDLSRLGVIRACLKNTLKVTQKGFGVQHAIRRIFYEKVTKTIIFRLYFHCYPIVGIL